MVSVMENINYTHIISADNGISSNGIALFSPDDSVKYEKLPIKRELSYTKNESHITRVDVPKLRQLLANWNLPKTTLVAMEKPFTNARRFRSTMSAMRCLEAELIVIEEFDFYLRYVISSEWQSVLLPGANGTDELKAASLALGKKLFPQFKLVKDADSLLIGYWLKYKDGQSINKKQL